MTKKDKPYRCKDRSEHLCVILNASASSASLDFYYCSQALVLEGVIILLLSGVAGGPRPFFYSAASLYMYI